MSIQKDRERLINEAMDAFETVREKLGELMDIGVKEVIENNASKFVDVNNALDDIYSAIEDLDA